MVKYEDWPPLVRLFSIGFGNKNYKLGTSILGVKLAVNWGLLATILLFCVNIFNSGFPKEIRLYHLFVFYAFPIVLINICVLYWIKKNASEIILPDSSLTQELKSWLILLLPLLIVTAVWILI